MIHNPHQGWSVCTPPKTGTYSIETVLGDWATVTRPRHAMTPWAGTRLMPVRRPIRRWLSMYRFLAKTGYWLPDLAQSSLLEFADGWMSRQDHVHWAPNLTSFASVYDPHEFFVMEDNGLQKMFDYLTDNFELPKFEVVHKNKTDRSTFDEDLRILQTSKHWNFIESWAQEDCDRFGVPMW